MKPLVKFVVLWFSVALINSFSMVFVAKTLGLEYVHAWLVELSSITAAFLVVLFAVGYKYWPKRKVVRLVSSFKTDYL